jgi:nitrite reductase/ring-hydroxylating ferredoxin subunit
LKGDITPSRIVYPVTFYPLEKLHVLREGYRRPFQIAGRQLLLIEEGGQYYLMENRCPHAGGSLHDGSLHRGHLTCPQHGICFNLQSGRPVNIKDLDNGMKLVFYKPAYRDNIIGVDL